MLRIDAVNLHWIRGVAPEDDLCAHGGVRVELDGRVLLEDVDAGTVSAGALHLLRALERDHLPGAPITENLIPCCGHFMVVDPESGEVVNVGCPNGVNWWVRHLPERRVELTFAGAEGVVVSAADWRGAVVAFSGAIRAFYFGGVGKRPSDPDEAEWHGAFVREWERRHAAAARSAGG